LPRTPDLLASGGLLSHQIWRAGHRHGIGLKGPSDQDIVLSPFMNASGQEAERIDFNQTSIESRCSTSRGSKN
jgi:hypothetical protein